MRRQRRFPLRRRPSDTPPVSRSFRPSQLKRRPPIRTSQPKKTNKQQQQQQHSFYVGASYSIDSTGAAKVRDATDINKKK